MRDDLRDIRAAIERLRMDNAQLRRRVHRLHGDWRVALAVAFLSAAVAAFCALTLCMVLIF